MSVAVGASTTTGNVNNGGLPIGGGITGASSNASTYGPGPQTDINGNAILWLIPNSGVNFYVLSATPPSGSPYLPTTSSNLTITNDTPETIVMQKPVSLKGHVYDETGAALPNQTVSLDSNSTTTDQSGSYSLTISTGTYQQFLVNNLNNRNNSYLLNIPQVYTLFRSNYTINQDTTLDITVPAMKVNVHVQDATGTGVSGIAIAAGTNTGNVNNGGLSMGGGITGASSNASTYGPGPQTDSNGNAVLWLIPNNGNNFYIFTASPPSGTIYNSFTSGNITVTSDPVQTELISLQYNHATPTTTATLFPTPDNQGNYPDPTTVTLSATAATGYTIANTYYTIDGGIQQTYATPFTISGNGSHTITYWSVDNSGVQETHNTKIFTIHTTYTLTGTVFTDTDRDGVEDNGETGYAGSTITLDSGQTTTTDSNGNYTFSNLPAATYTETLSVPNGYTATTTNPTTVPVAANTTQNFGIVQNNALVTAINTGGDTQSNYVADTDYTGGTTYTSSHTVDTSSVNNPAPQAVYQSVRYGNFTYTIPNLTPNNNYTLRLHFNELYWGTDGSDATGKRVFNVSINGTQVLTNFDIYQTAGGANTAIVQQFPTTADANGNITIQFSTVVDNAMVNGIELYNGTLPSPTPSPTPTPVSSLSINAGGNTASSFVSDTDFSGGTPYTSTATVDTSSITNPAGQSVYQTVRYGNFTYTIPHLFPNTNYTVRLHFNELYWGTDLAGGTGGIGSRVFNTSINGQQVLSNYDIFQDAGGANKAVIKQFTTTSDANGKISIVFTTVTDNAMVSGIEVSL
jgi:hypothetical protein